MNIKRFILMAALLTTGAVACNDDDKQIEDTPQYPITAVRSEQYRIDVKERETAGKEVSATVTSLDATMRIAGVTCNDMPCTFRSGDDAEGVWVFTMPAAAVTLTAQMEKRPQAEPETYTITVAPNDYCEVEVAESAKGGETVDLKITLLDPSMRIVSVACNDMPCTLVSEVDLVYDYSFTMPEAAATIHIGMDIDYHPITPQQGEHTTLAILNCHYNYGTPEHIIQAFMGQFVRYTVTAEIGYELRQSVRGESGSDVPFAWEDHDDEYGACWRFIMPDEPVTVIAEAVEKSLYDGKPFVGDYKGYELFTPENRLISIVTPTTEFSLKANTVFTMKSTDRNGFDFDGCYAFDEAAGTFAYDRATCHKTYGAEGALIDDDDLSVCVRNTVDDKPDNNRYYIFSKRECSFVCASDPYHVKFLMELDKGGTKVYYYSEYGSVSKVDVAFDAGSSIGEASSMLVRRDGEILFRYTLDAAGGTPEFRYLGREAGTYTLAGGPDLVLDGFGGATVGDRTGTYTIEGGIVTFTSGETAIKYLIDPLAMTYYEVKSDVAWDGTANHFYGKGAYGYNSSVSSSWIECDATLDLDRDMNGQVKERYASIRMSVPNDFFGRDMIVSDCVPYIYDPDSGSLILAQVLQGKKGAWGQERRDIELRVSEDKQTITFVTEYVYSLSSPNKYVYATDIQMTEPTE